MRKSEHGPLFWTFGFLVKEPIPLIDEEIVSIAALERRYHNCLLAIRATRILLQFCCNGYLETPDNKKANTIIYCIGLS